MSLPAAGLAVRRHALWKTSAQARERSVRRRIGLVWALLILNALAFYPGSVLPVPSAVGKSVAQAALPVALLVALTVNRRIVVRPNVFLCLVTLLVAEALVTSVEPQSLGAVYRTFRFAEFTAVCWLLTPWWGSRRLLLVRAHLAGLSVVLGSVLLGVFVAPGHALAGRRVSGVLWPIPPPQVAHYAAVVTGLVAVLWLCGQLRGRLALLAVAVTGSILLATHTRTALIAMITGLVVAGMSLIVARPRVRRFFAIASVIVVVAITTFSSVLTTWLARGQGAEQLNDLTGRTKVWGALLALPRDRFQEIFGFGLSNSSFNGLPIDSNWLASYQGQGLLGVLLCTVVVLFLLVAAYFQPRGMRRALALFLLTYCLVASFTEVGFTDVSVYLLELTLAASLLVPVRPAGPLPEADDDRTG